MDLEKEEHGFTAPAEELALTFAFGWGSASAPR